MPIMSGTSPPRIVPSPRSTTMIQLRPTARASRLKRANAYAAHRAAEPIVAASDPVAVPAAYATSMSTAHAATMYAATVMIVAPCCVGF